MKIIDFFWNPYLIQSLRIHFRLVRCGRDLSQIFDCLRVCHFWSRANVFMFPCFSVGLKLGNLVRLLQQKLAQFFSALALLLDPSNSSTPISPEFIWSKAPNLFDIRYHFLGSHSLRSVTNFE